VSVGTARNPWAGDMVAEMRSSSRVAGIRQPNGSSVNILSTANSAIQLVPARGISGT
jgi:hypothetical protein